MAQNKSKITTKNPAPKVTRSQPAPAPEVDVDVDDDDRPLSPRKRKRLLARVAGTVAAGIIQEPSETTSTSEGLAEVAVDVAEAILARIGL